MQYQMFDPVTVGVMLFVSLVIVTLFVLLVSEAKANNRREELLMAALHESGHRMCPRTTAAIHRELKLAQQ